MNQLEAYEAFQKLSKMPAHSHVFSSVSGNIIFQKCSICNDQNFIILPKEDNEVFQWKEDFYKQHNNCKSSSD